MPPYQVRRSCHGVAVPCPGCYPVSLSALLYPVSSSEKIEKHKWCAGTRPRRFGEPTSPHDYSGWKRHRRSTPHLLCPRLGSLDPRTTLSQLAFLCVVIYLYRRHSLTVVRVGRIVPSRWAIAVGWLRGKCATKHDDDMEERRMSVLPWPLPGRPCTVGPSRQVNASLG
jgi:hypothetical protein